MIPKIIPLATIASFLGRGYIRRSLEFPGKEGISTNRSIQKPSFQAGTQKATWTRQTQVFCKASMINFVEDTMSCRMLGANTSGAVKCNVVTRCFNSQWISKTCHICWGRNMI